MKICIHHYFEALDNNYVLICTSNSLEKKAINERIEHRRELAVGIDSLGCCIGLINSRFVIHLSGESGFGRTKSVGRLVIHFINTAAIPKPAFVVLSGFCWGNPTKVGVDNIIISSDIISLNSDAYFQDKTEYKGSKFTSTISAEFLKGSIDSELAVVGELASLETLMASSDKRDNILDRYPSILGGEMEAFSFVPSLDSIPWLIVKAVSDFAGDDFERDGQNIAAKNAAVMVQSIIGLYVSEKHINLSTTSSDQLFLVDSLFGKSIKVTHNEVNPSNLNDYLESLGSLIKYKLSYYLIGDEYGAVFVKHFCSLILEVAQNAFKHGAATEVTITFEKERIFIQDNGNDYELSNLLGAKGGASSWSKVKSNYVDTDIVSYSFNKKKHKFNLLKLNEDIDRVIRDCTAKIATGRIGNGWGNNGVLSFSDTCEAVYVDDRKINMLSTRYSVIEDVRAIIDAGKIVFVSVSDNEDAEGYKALGFSPEKVKIMVHS